MDPLKMCSICLVKAQAGKRHYSHYGSLCCFSCKAFFRRAIRDNLTEKFVCKNRENCDFTQTERTSCKKCRFNKCLEIGLDPSKVLIDEKDRRKFTHPKIKKCLKSAQGARTLHNTTVEQSVQTLHNTMGAQGGQNSVHKAQDSANFITTQDVQYAQGPQNVSNIVQNFHDHDAVMSVQNAQNVQNVQILHSIHTQPLSQGYQNMHILNSLPQSSNYSCHISAIFEDDTFTNHISNPNAVIQGERRICERS